MIASEKSKQLVENFSIDNTSTSHRYAKKFALLAVDEMINMCKLYYNHNVVVDTNIYADLSISYLQEVKKEIELL